MSLKWDGRHSGVYDQQYSFDAGEGVLEVFTDSDKASDRQSRRWVSCCLVCYGRCLLCAASRTQKVISLSSAEAEVYAWMFWRHLPGQFDFLVEWEAHAYPSLHRFIWSQENTSKNGRWKVETSFMQDPLVATADRSWDHLQCSSFWTLQSSIHW